MAEITYSVAMAIGFEAGKANAKKHGRKVWTVDDFNVATLVADELLGNDPNKDENHRRTCKADEISRLIKKSKRMAAMPNEKS
jgi:hypothetical protein